MSIILVTGASRGIGSHLCRRLQREGHEVFAGMREPGEPNELDDLLASGAVRALRLDVDSERQSRIATESLLAHTGRIDVLINNAGIAKLAPVELQSERTLRDTMETNFFGAMRVTRAVLPAMRKQRSGKIINVSSLAAFHGLPAEAAYCASKSALDAASQALALEVERFGIHVTSIRPGYTRGGLAVSHVASDVARDTEYEPLLGHLEDLYAQSAKGAESPDLVARAVSEVLASDAPPPRIELGELATAVAVVRQGDPSARLDSMRAVCAMEWWRAGGGRPSGDGRS